MSKRELTPLQLMDRDIMTSFRSRIWSNFTKAVSEYKLIDENDHIAVCISGGKDSMVLAKCMQLLQRYSKVNFKLTYMVMNPGYNEKNKQKIIDNANKMGLRIIMYETDIFDVVAAQTGGSPCYLCARMRRGALYKKAQELGCNKIALGHHFDDVIETIMMSIIYGAKVQSMMPKLHSDNFEGLEHIRPFYYVREKDIIAFSKKNELEFIRCACHFTEKVASGEIESKRKEIKQMLEGLRKIDKNIDMNIFRSMYNVNTDTAISYQKDTVTYHFLDNYDRQVKLHSKQQFERTKMMFNDENMEKIYNSKVAIFGIGGVGGYVAEALARSGVTTFYLYDPDVISITNLNRQIMATYKTLGKDKVAAMKERILSINPDAEVYTYKMFVDANSIKDVNFENVDYCIDTLDTITTKILLIKTCNELNIPLISCMGTGNHFDPSSFKVMDLAKTSYDPVAKVLRRELKKHNITHQKVVCSIEQPLNSVIEENGRHAPASNAFTPSSAGILIASEVIKDIIK